MFNAFNATEAAPPNIVFILADDLGWTDTATYGSKYYETPNIDKLAAQGLKLTRYHNCQNCQPTRAALMTGQYGTADRRLHCRRHRAIRVADAAVASR